MMDLLRRREGTCGCCGGPLVQASGERFHNWCAGCNVLYSYYRQTVEQVGEERARVVKETIHLIAVRDIDEGNARRPSKVPTNDWVDELGRRI